MSRSLALFSLGIFLLVVSCFAEKAPYASFAQDATLTDPVVVNYDYIIIGGGTAGCALATTLSGTAKVLVLERGGLPYNIPAIHKSGVVLNMLDTSPTSAAQSFVSTDGVFNLRGRVLGGSSAINGGLYSRASDQEVLENGWDVTLVNDSYLWVESKLVHPTDVGVWQSAVRAGLLEAGVTPDRGYTLEHLIGTKNGGSTFDANGTRHGAADLLEYADPNNIDVYLYATVHQILFNTTLGQKPKANGVLFKDSNGISHKAFLNNKNTSEIILSAGALGSPQLLMPSGIGPAQELKAHGIEVILGQDLVGQGMSDNPLNGLLIPSPKPIELSVAEVVGIGEFNYFEAASGFIQIDLPKLTLAANLINPANEIIQPINQILTIVTEGLGSNPKPNAQIGLVHQKVAVPYSTGLLKLKNRDPSDNPIVTFNYYQDPRDVENCVKGMEILKNVVDSKSFSSFRPPFTSFQHFKNIMLLLPVNLRTRHFNSTYNMEQYCKDTVMTVWHYHGGCQVGKVVDHDYKVIGIDSLRVIDGSTFVNSPGTNPHATLMMLGRYMGQRIIQEQGTT